MSIKFPLRQYSIACDEDYNNLQNNRCPDYALCWGKSMNCFHWPSGHDYFMGTGENLNGEKYLMELRQILSEKLIRGSLRKKIVFCDLDGVLADFKQGVINTFEKSIEELNQDVMWNGINNSETFFDALPWMPRGRELWEAIRKYDPIILTGIPNNSSVAAEQKRKWCARELGEDVHVITCMTKDKPKYCIDKSLLIDDRDVNLNDWNKMSGKFILYHEDFTYEIIERIHKYMRSYSYDSEYSSVSFSY